MLASDIFINKTKRKYVYNITAIEDIQSIIKNGILCYEEARRLPHYSIAMDVVQKRRQHVIVPNGLRLHCYANLYFDYNNPMLYKRKDIAEGICILAIHAVILDNPGCVISDRNAAADLAKFYPSLEGVSLIDFDKIFAQYWGAHNNLYEQMNHKAIKCAEILIPKCVPYGYVAGANVVNNKAKDALLSVGFDKKIVISNKAFYR